jgi:hypothetical protein
MLKELFIEKHGVPACTVGVGGPGGGPSVWNGILDRRPPGACTR